MINNKIYYILLIPIIIAIYISYMMCESSDLRVGSSRYLFCKNPILYLGTIAIGTIMVSYISKIKNK